MKKLFLVTVSVVALSVVAYAADLPLPLKARVFAPPPLLTWAGSYVGILGGVAYHRATLNPNCTPDLGCETTELTRTGGTIGTFLGHNWQQGNFVYGFESDWLGGAKTGESGLEISKSFDVRWVGTVRGRAGLAFDTTPPLPHRWLCFWPVRQPPHRPRGRRRTDRVIYRQHDVSRVDGRGWHRAHVHTTLDPAR
ncbi:MAG: hypothetical protein WCC77_20255 [Pseudolabrys sp.]